MRPIGLLPGELIPKKKLKVFLVDLNYTQSQIVSTAQLQEKLKTVIKNGDSRLLKMLYAVAKEYSSQDYTQPGKPMSTLELKNRVKAAKARIKSGKFTTQSDLEKEMNEW